MISFFESTENTIFFLMEKKPSTKKPIYHISLIAIHDKHPHSLSFLLLPVERGKRSMFALPKQLRVELEKSPVTFPADHYVSRVKDDCVVSGSAGGGGGGSVAGGADTGNLLQSQREFYPALALLLKGGGGGGYGLSEREVQATIKNFKKEMRNRVRAAGIEEGERVLREEGGENID